MFCTHLKVTSCKLALYRLTLPHLQERGQWETKRSWGWPYLRRKHHLRRRRMSKTFSIEVGTLFGLIVFATSILNKTKGFLAFLFG